MWSRGMFLSSFAASAFCLRPGSASAQFYAPPFTVEGTADLEHEGQLRRLRFAPERGAAPIQCMAAILPRATFRSTLIDVRNRSNGYSAVVDLARRNSATVAINGGFFNFDAFTPDGLLVVAGKTIHAARPDYKNAIVIDNSGALSIVPSSSSAPNAAFAIQGHPGLVEDGGKMGMRSDAAERDVRSFVAQAGDAVIVGVTSPVTLYHLADVLVLYPEAFGSGRIAAAVNLSGSATTSFYARLTDGSEVLQRSTWPNREVLLFSPRSPAAA